MNIENFKKLQRDYEVIQNTLPIIDHKNFDRNYTSLLDALTPYLKADEEELYRIVYRLNELTEVAILEIQKQAKQKLK
jgi:hypothetical protein